MIATMPSTIDNDDEIVAHLSRKPSAIEVSERLSCIRKRPVAAIRTVTDTISAKANVLL
jgi:hypothetical protein